MRLEDSLVGLAEPDALALLEQMAKFAGSTAEAPGSAEAETHSEAWKTEQRYRSLIEQLPVVTFMASLDERTQELYISPQIEALLGYTQAEWLDNPILWYRRLHPDDRAAWVAEFAQTCATGSKFRSEYRMIAKDGRLVWIQGECQVVRDERGRPMFLQGVAFDITHIKRAAEDEEAKLAAQAASRAKSEFLAHMSHEIRTPLNGVIGMTDLLLGSELTPQQRRQAHLVKSSADALLGVINDILDFSKIEAGKLELDLIDFDLQQAVDDVADMLAHKATAKNLELACSIDPAVPAWVRGDPGRLRQVLINLVNNALKFTQRGEVVIRVVQKSRTAENAVVRFSIKDTGIGIPPDRLNRLFKSFSQVDASTTRKFGGTGLGLAISKQLVELMGGQIGIESQVGQGSTFWFDLSFEKRPSGAASGFPLESIADLHGMRVLAVDDNPTYCEILKTRLDTLQLDAQTFDTGSKALEAMSLAAAAGKPFQIAILDLMMPEMDGIELARRIKAEPALRQTKLLLLSAMELQPDAEHTRQVGFGGYLPKPARQSELFDALMNLVAGKGSIRPSNVPAAEIRPAESMGPDHKDFRILLAEDNEVNQVVATQILAKAGYRCDIVADGRAAFEAATAQTYDLVLMDCQMPELDGFEATAAIRQAEAKLAAQGAPARHTPIIAVTANAIKGDELRCRDAGMDGYVTKPLNPKILIDTIHHWAGLKAAKAAPAGAQTAAAPASPAATPTPGAPAPAQPAPSDPPPIDLKTLMVRCMDDAAFMERIVGHFQTQVSQTVAQIEQALQQTDAKAVALSAHSLKGMAANLSADALSNLSGQVEHLGREGQIDQAKATMDALQREVDRCLAYIPQLRAPSG